MRRFFISFPLFFLISLSVLADNNKLVTLHFNEEDFSIGETNGKIHINMPKRSVVFKNDTLSPALPFISIYVLIAPNEVYDSSNASSSEVLLRKEVVMNPNPKLLPTLSSHALRPLRDVSFEGSHPKSIIEYTGTYEFGVFRVLSFLVCPFRYEANGGKLFLKNQVDISISLKICSKNCLENKKVGKLHQRNIERLVVNKEDIASLYGSTAMRITTSNNTDSASYLIITRDSLRPEFQPLADWKTTKGVKAKIMTLEYIYSHYTDRNNQLKIKHAIKDYYEASDGVLEYVLLGGDNSIIPVQRCYNEITLSGDTQPTQANAPSDMFYACLTNLEWDTNQNNRYGEVSDNVSIVPDIVLTRLPVSNIIQARKNIKKIISYEMNPSTDGWKNEILMCAVENEDRDTINGRIYSSFHLNSENMYSQYIAPTSWTGTKYRFYDTGTDNPLDTLGVSYEVNDTNLQSELSKGYAFVNVYTHGDDNFWILEGYIYNSYFDYKARSLSSPRYTIITTEACHTNNLWYDSNLGSAFFKGPNSGIIGYYGSSNLGLNGITEMYTGGMYRELFQGNGMGNAVYDSKLDRIGNCNTYGSFRWLHLFLVPLCDPEMPVYNSIPTKLSDLSIHHYNDAFNIYYYGESRFNCCVSSRFDIGNTYYNNLMDCNEVVNLSNMQGEYMVCITLPQKVPFRSIIGSSVYLQNESLSDNLNVTTDYTYIGSHVKNDRDEGPVFVENGSSTIETRYGATIDGNFEVRLGASLEISTGQPSTE